MRIFHVILAAAALLTGPAALAQATTQSVVQEHVNAFRDRDIQRLVDTFTEDAIVTMNALEYIGEEQIQDHFMRRFRHSYSRVNILESKIESNRVYLRVSFVMDDGRVACCLRWDYNVTNGKIAAFNSEGLAVAQ